MSERERAQEQLLEELRPLAFGIAYRMLGSVAEAEDIAQEALLRVTQALDAQTRLASPRAFLTTVATRLSIDELRSARARREAYVGAWLPEPIITAGRGDPAPGVETSDSISMAMLVLLETLSPEQRAAFLLHDAFDYTYREIAGIIGTSEENARQLATRARRHIRAGRPRFQTTPQHQAELARRFFAAARDGELAALKSLLAEDVVLTGDGGGKAPALARPLQGRSRVALALRNWARARERIVGDVRFELVELNGSQGALVLDARDRVAAALTLDIDEQGIRRVMSVVNPDKLAHLGPVSNIGALLRGADGS